MGILRLLLALSVVLHHTGTIQGYMMLGGDIPVRTFFIISGFYMTLILYERYPVGKYRLFIVNRFLRIFPLYWLVLFSTLLFLTVTHTLQQYSIGRFISDSTLLVRTDYFAFNPEMITPFLIPQAWSLAVELLFYLIAPYLVHKKVKTLVSIGCISIIIRFLVYRYEVLQGFQPKDWFFLSDLVFFVLGILSFRLFQVTLQSTLSQKIKLVRWIILIVFTLFYFYIPEFQYKYISLRQIVYYGMTFLLLPSIFGLWKNNRFDRLLGELSYPIYIWHQLIALLLTRSGLPNSPSFNPIIVSFFSVLISFLSLLLLQQPIDRYRVWRLQRARKS